MEKEKKEKVMRLTEGEKSLIEFLREREVFLTELEVAIDRAIFEKAEVKKIVEIKNKAANELYDQELNALGQFRQLLSGLRSSRNN